MKKFAALALVAALGVLSTLAFAKNEKGPWTAVFTVTTKMAVDRSKKKSGTDFWVSEHLAAAFNQLEAQGYEIKQVCPSEERILIIARKK